MSSECTITGIFDPNHHHWKFICSSWTGPILALYSVFHILVFCPFLISTKPSGWSFSYNYLTIISNPHQNFAPHPKTFSTWLKLFSPKSSPQPQKKHRNNLKKNKKSKRWINGGAGNRTQIEAGIGACNSSSSWRPLEEKPQHHVLPLHHTTLLFDGSRGWYLGRWREDKLDPQVWADS